jgi:hypothetical protein
VRPGIPRPSSPASASAAAGPASLRPVLLAHPSSLPARLRQPEREDGAR